MLRKKYNIFLTFTIYVCFILELYIIYTNVNVCTFSHTVQDCNNINFSSAKQKYIYTIEQKFIDEYDLYRLINISGWIVQNDDRKYSPVEASLLLTSENNSYKIQIFSEKRFDCQYVDQSNRKSSNLYVGWFCKIPAEDIELGNYRIAFIIKEDGRQVILYTDEMIEII